MLKYGADNALPSTTAVIIDANTGGTAALDLSGFNGTIGSLTFGGVDGLPGSVNQVATGSGMLTLGGDGTSVATGSPTASDTISGKLDLGGATRTFTVGDSGGNFAEMDVQAVISGSGVGITKAGVGVLVLSGANTYNGATTVNAGLLRLANNSALGTSAGGTTVNDGASIGLAGVTITDESMTFIGLGIVDPAGAVAGALRNYSGNNTIAGSGNIDIGSDSVLTTRINAYINPTTLTLSGAGVVRGAAAGDQTLELYGQGLSAGIISRVIQNGIATSLSVTKAEAGTWTLSAANTYTGTTTVTAGTLAVTGSGNLAATSAVVVTGGSLLIGASNVINDAATVAMGGGTIAMNNGSYTETMGALTLTANSTLDFGTTGSTFKFSGFTPDGFILNVASWTASDHLIFTASQESNLGQFNFSGFGAAQVSVTGGFEIIAVSEPGTLMACPLILGVLGWVERRRLSRLLGMPHS